MTTFWSSSERDAYAENYALNYFSHRRDAQYFVDIANPQDGQNILDLCCGTGFIALNIMSRLNYGTVVAVDVSGRALEILQASYNRLAIQKGNVLPNLVIIQGDISDETVLSNAQQSLPSSSSCPTKFDLITYSLGIQLLDEPVEQHLRLWSQYLAPEGHIVINSPFVNPDHREVPIKIEARLHKKQELQQLQETSKLEAWCEENQASDETATLWMSSGGRGPQVAVSVCSKEETRLALAAGLNICLIVPAHVQRDTDVDVGELVNSWSFKRWNNLDDTDIATSCGEYWTSAHKNDTVNDILPLFLLDQRYVLVQEYRSGKRLVPGIRVYDSHIDEFVCESYPATVIVVMGKAETGTTSTELGVKGE